MQRIAGRLVFSPSDLNHFLECEHLIHLQRRPDARDLVRARDEQADLLARKGLEHERTWLARFEREQPGGVVSIASDGPERDWTKDAERTIRAMREGLSVRRPALSAVPQFRGM